MKNIPSRRIFLRNSLLGTTGLALLSSTSAFGSVFNDGSPYSGYNQYTDFSTDLRTNIFGDNDIKITGTIYNKDGSEIISDALIEVWHLSPNSKKYNHRGKFTSNEMGEYSFITEFPNYEKSKYPRIFFKISKGEKVEFTELCFNMTGALITSDHWQKNRGLGKKLLPKQTTSLTGKKYKFNITI